MIDENDDDIQAVLDAALRDLSVARDPAKHLQPSSEPAELGDESEMTSVMGPEERRLLQQAARSGAPRPPAAPRAAAPDDGDHARPTARPPSSGNEQATVVVSDSLGTSELDAKTPLPTSESAGTPVAHSSTHGRERPSSAWPVVAFILLAAAAWFAARQ